MLRLADHLFTQYSHDGVWTHTRQQQSPFPTFPHTSATGKGQREERETATCNIEGDALLMALDSLIWTQKDKLRSYMKWFN